MSTVTTSSAAIDLALLDELLETDELWSDRDQEAANIAEHISRSRSPIVVLHGPRRSGKTELIRRRVAPLVAQQRRVRFHGDPDAPDPSAADASGTIEFWDSFESAVSGNEADHADVIRIVSAALDGARGCRLVLIIADDALNRLFQLCGSIPQIVEDIVEIPRIATRPLFDHVGRMTARRGVTVAESFLAALTRDLAAENTVAGAQLAAILVFEICRLKPRGNEAGAEYYELRGRLAGILEAHLNFLLDRLPDGLDPQMGWAVIEEVAMHPATAEAPALTEVDARFDAREGVAAQVLHWLEQTRRILHRRPTGEYDLVPPQLAVAARARQQRDAMADEHQVLRQAARNVADADALLSESSFRRIHSRRSALRVSEEEARLMLRCSLAYGGATRHWLRRVRDPDVQVDVLLEAMFDTRADVRRRAARHLRAFPRPDVRNQLHLLALRDSSDAVRAQAVQSLEAIKDEELLTSLVQEIREPHSPYRLQAIDALRIFAAPAATAALVRVVRTNAAGEDLEARHRAIDVLGRQQTTGAAEALIETALQDPDAEDRDRAARALGAMGSEPALRFVLDRLHQLTRAAKAWHLSWSWRGVLLWAVNAVLAVAAVFLNFLIHGFVLMTMRRWRLGVALSLLGAGGFALLVSSSNSGLGAVVFAAPMVLGLLIPFRLLVLERRTGPPSGWYRRSLGAVVFGSCLMMFLYFHGLACMLTRRFRLGLALMAFEMLGVLLFLGALYTESEFGPFAELSPVFNWISLSFTVIGFALLAVTSVVGIGTVWLDAFWLQQRREQLRRIDAVQRALASNAAVPALLLADCLDGARHKARWSRGLLRKFGREMRTGLTERWEPSDTRMRWAIFSLLARHHDPQSMGFLDTARRSLDWRASALYGWANLAYRMAVWPKPLLLALAIVLYVQVAALAVFIVHRPNEPGRLRARATDAVRPLSERTDAINRLRQLAQQRQDRDVANIAASSLADIVARPQFALESSELMAAGLEAVAGVAAGSEEAEKLVAAVANMLAVRDLRERAVATLKEIGTSAAVMRLREFIERPISAREEQDAEMGIRRVAIDALASIRGADTIDALTALSTSDTLRPELREAALAAVMSDPLIRAESALTTRDYTLAIEMAREVIADGSSQLERLSRARQVLSRAHTSLGSIAFDKGEYADAKASVLAALDAGVPIGSDDPLFNLSLNVTYEYHERFAPKDPAAYQEVYTLLLRLRGAAGEMPVDGAVLANLAEASLTTGRYAEAVDVARELLARPAVDAGTTLNMKFITYAALVMFNESADAARQDLLAYYRTLPKGFENDWSYTGTRNFIERSALGPAEKKLVFDALNLVEQPK